MAEAFKLYKLIILYMLDKVDFPLTNSQISEFILNEGYTTYFKLQQARKQFITLKMIFHLQSRKILTVFSVINNMN